MPSFSTPKANKIDSVHMYVIQMCTFTKCTHLYSTALVFVAVQEYIKLSLICTQSLLTDTQMIIMLMLQPNGTIQLYLYSAYLQTSFITQH